MHADASDTSDGADLHGHPDNSDPFARWFRALTARTTRTAVDKDGVTLFERREAPWSRGVAPGRNFQFLDHSTPHEFTNWEQAQGAWGL